MGDSLCAARGVVGAELLAYSTWPAALRLPFYLTSLISTNGELEIAIAPRTTIELARPQSWGFYTSSHATTYV